MPAPAGAPAGSRGQDRADASAEQAARSAVRRGAARTTRRSASAHGRDDRQRGDCARTPPSPRRAAAPHVGQARTRTSAAARQQRGQRDERSGSARHGGIRAAGAVRADRRAAPHSCVGRVRGASARGTRAYSSSASEKTSRCRNRAAVRSVTPCASSPAAISSGSTARSHSSRCRCISSRTGSAGPPCASARAAWPSRRRRCVPAGSVPLRGRGAASSSRPGAGVPRLRRSPGCRARTHRARAAGRRRSCRTAGVDCVARSSGLPLPGFGPRGLPPSDRFAPGRSGRARARYGHPRTPRRRLRGRRYGGRDGRRSGEPLHGVAKDTRTAPAHDGGGGTVRAARPAAGHMGLRRDARRAAALGPPCVARAPGSLRAHGPARHQLQVDAAERRDVLLDREQFECPRTRGGAQPRPARAGRAAAPCRLSASARGLRGGTTSPVPPITSQTAPTSVETVARPQNIASTRETGKPSTTLESTTTPPARRRPRASARPGRPSPRRRPGSRPTADARRPPRRGRAARPAPGSATRTPAPPLPRAGAVATIRSRAAGTACADLGEGVQQRDQILGGLDPPDPDQVGASAARVRPTGAGRVRRSSPTAAKGAASMPG